MSAHRRLPDAEPRFKVEHPDLRIGKARLHRGLRGLVDACCMIDPGYPVFTTLISHSQRKTDIPLFFDQDSSGSAGF